MRKRSEMSYELNNWYTSWII